MADEHQTTPDSTAPPEATETAPSEVPEEPRLYTAAEQRAAIFERTGARDMGDFHPHAPPREPELEQPTAQATVPAEATAAPESPTEQPSNELAELRAQVAALHAKLTEPDADDARAEPEAPKDPDHPLAAHARQILGPHATPKHVGRAAALLEQRYQWQQHADWHEANPSDEAPKVKGQAQRAMASLDQQLDDLAETVTLRAELAAMRGELERRDKPDPRDAAAKLIDSAFGNAEALGQHYPNLVTALAADPEYGAELKAQMLALPMGDRQEWAQNAERLLVISERALKAAKPKQPATQPPTPEPAAKGATPVPKATPTAPPQPGERYPVRPSAPIGQEDTIYSRKDFWSRVNEGAAARGRSH